MRIGNSRSILSRFHLRQPRNDKADLRNMRGIWTRYAVPLNGRVSMLSVACEHRCRQFVAQQGDPKRRILLIIRKLRIPHFEPGGRRFESVRARDSHKNFRQRLSASIALRQQFEPPTDNKPGSTNRRRRFGRPQGEPSVSEAEGPYGPAAMRPRRARFDLRVLPFGAENDDLLDLFLNFGRSACALLTTGEAGQTMLRP